MTVCKIFLLIILLILENNVSGEQNPFELSNPVANVALSKCIHKILKKHYSCGTLISVVINKRVDVDNIIQYLSDEVCYSFLLRKFKHENWLFSTEVYIIIAENGERFVKGMSKLTADAIWDPISKVIIKIQNPQENDTTIVFDILLRYNIFSGILLEENAQNISIYTYYPFNNTNCGLKYEFAKIGTCSNNDNKIQYFSFKKINLKNCNVTVVANNDVTNFIEKGPFTENDNSETGLEQFILDTIAHKEGITMHYRLVEKELSFGVVLPNNTATGLLSFLQRDEVDIAAGGIILIKNRMDMFDFIWGYNYAVFNLFTPAIGEEIWKDVYREFSIMTWLLIVVAYFTVTSIAIIIRKWQSKILKNRTLLILTLWGYLYTNTSRTLAKERRMRTLTVFWIWFTFFICNFYNTALYSLLTGRNQIKRHMSVDDLHTLPFEPCIVETTRTYFQFSVNKTLPLGRNLPQCQRTDDALDYVVSSKNAYAIEMEYEYALKAYKYYDEDGNPKLDTWTFSTNNVIVMYLTKGFPMLREFQLYAWRLYESGILNEHLKKLMFQKNPKVHQHKVHFKKMVLSDLRIHFSILAVGSILSLMCFIFELIWHRVS